MEKKKMLLHSCCGPCSTAVIDRLKEDFDLTIFYYNPSIYPKEEYIHRLNEQKRYVSEAGLNIVVIDGTYKDYNKFYEGYKGLENEKEGGIRCTKCFHLRLEKTAQIAKVNNFDYFTTTLSVSPYKDSQKLNKIGEVLSKEYNIKYLYSDFKKKEGYKRSNELAKKYNLYRQHYCGCKYSLNEANEYQKQKEQYEKEVCYYNHNQYNFITCTNFFPFLAS